MAATISAWDEAHDMLVTGRLATWLQGRGGDRDEATLLRCVASRLTTLCQKTPGSLSGALNVNENLPLCLRGEIIAPAWSEIQKWR